MSKDKKYFTLAKNINQTIVCADDVKRDSGYYCLECGGELVLHRGEKELRRPHFVHKNTSNCKPETVLHAGFKMLVAERIKGDIKDNKEINVQWSCDSCSKDHTMDLSQKVSQVFIEKSLSSEFRPDILLTDKDGKPFAVIEVVVTHAPEEQYIQFLKKEGIILIRFDLKSESNIRKAKQKILKPTSMKCCLNPKCDKCGKYKTMDEMMVITSDCWKCGSPLNVAVIEKNGQMLSPRSFTKENIKVAKDNGVIIQCCESKMAGESYMANICLHCKSIMGDHYLFTDHYCVAKYGECHFEVVNLGYSCICERKKIELEGREKDRDRKKISDVQNSKRKEEFMKELRETIAYLESKPKQ